LAWPHARRDVCSLLVSFASVKLKGDYFVLATLAFQMIVFTVLYNCTDVTRGPYGIAGIPAVKLFGIIEISGVYGYFVLTTVVSAIVILLFRNLKTSPYGRVLTAIRSDELTVSATGRNPVRFKTYAFFISTENKFCNQCGTRLGGELSTSILECCDGGDDGCAFKCNGKMLTGYDYAGFDWFDENSMKIKGKCLSTARTFPEKLQENFPARAFHSFCRAGVCSMNFRCGKT
jgi:hypothetical protein